jgi:hypothetical protein
MANFHIFWPDEQSLRPNKVGMTKNNEKSHFLVIIRGSKTNQKRQSSELSPQYGANQIQDF